MKIDKIALVSLGSIGRRHLRILKKIRPEIEITIVRSGLGQKWPEEKFAARVVRSIDEAIKEGVVAAIIASPSSDHILQAIEFAEAGVHLLVEKPLSTSLNMVSKLVKKMHSKRLVDLLGYMFHYDPAAQRFAEIINSNSLGKLLYCRVECGSYLPDWRPEQDYRKTVSASFKKGGGALLELSHEFDYIRWFLGNVSSVRALNFNSGHLQIEVEESSDLIFESEAGFPISMHLDFYRRHPSRFCCVIGARGQITWDIIKKEIVCIPADGRPEVESFEFEREFMYREQLHHFLDCIENGTKPKVRFSDGEAVLKIIEAARSSHKKGRKVTLN